MNILIELKEQTRPQHDALETKLDLLRKDFSQADYLELLKSFYGFYLPLEKSLEKISLPISIQARRKVPQLIHDLLKLGMKEEEIQKLPICQNLPELMTPAQCMGVIYVMEGSTLGGLVLTKHFERNLSLSEFLFFAGYGENTLPMWKQFQQELTTFFSDDVERGEKIISSARSTFNKLQTWLVKG